MHVTWLHCFQHLFTINTVHTSKLFFASGKQEAIPFMLLKCGDKLICIKKNLNTCNGDKSDESESNMAACSERPDTKVWLRKGYAGLAVEEARGTACMHSFYWVQWVLHLHMNKLIYLDIWCVYYHAYVNRQMNAEWSVIGLCNWWEQGDE